MPLQCNIDAKGKRMRLVYGAAFLVTGLLVMVIWAIPAGKVLVWAISGLLMIGGGFAIFEARAGWCIVRAMGFRTPW